MKLYNFGIMFTLKNAFSGTYNKILREYISLRKEVEKSIPVFDDAEKAFKQLNAGIMSFGAGAAVLSTLVLPTKYAIEFGRAMGEVMTIADPATGSLNSLSQAVERLSMTFGETPAKQAKGLYQAISSGVLDSRDAIQLMEISNKAAIAGIAGNFEVVDVMTSIMNAFKISVAEAAKVSDQLFVAIKLGKTTMPELSAELGDVAAIASMSGISIGEVTSAIATLTLTGQSTATAVTNLRGLLTNVIRPKKEALDMAKELGVDFSIAAIKTKGLYQFLVELGEAAQNNAEVYGKFFRRIEGMNAVMALVGMKEKYKEVQHEIMIASDNTEEAYRKIVNTLGFQFDVLKAKILVIFQNIGKGVSTFLMPIVKILNIIFGTLAKIMQIFPMLNILIAGTTAALGVGLIVNGLGKMKSGLAKIWGTMLKGWSLKLDMPINQLTSVLHGLVPTFKALLPNVLMFVVAMKAVQYIVTRVGEKINSAFTKAKKEIRDSANNLIMFEKTAQGVKMWENMDSFTKAVWYFERLRDIIKAVSLLRAGNKNGITLIQPGTELYKLWQNFRGTDTWTTIEKLTGLVNKLSVVGKAFIDGFLAPLEAVADFIFWIYKGIMKIVSVFTGTDKSVKNINKTFNTLLPIIKAIARLAGMAAVSFAAWKIGAGLFKGFDQIRNIIQQLLVNKTITKGYETETIPTFAAATTMAKVKALIERMKKGWIPAGTSPAGNAQTIKEFEAYEKRRGMRGIVENLFERLKKSSSKIKGSTPEGTRSEINKAIKDALKLNKKGSFLYDETVRNLKKGTSAASEATLLKNLQKRLKSKFFKGEDAKTAKTLAKTLEKGFEKEKAFRDVKSIEKNIAKRIKGYNEGNKKGYWMKEYDNDGKVIGKKFTPPRADVVMPSAGTIGQEKDASVWRRKVINPIGRFFNKIGATINNATNSAVTGVKNFFQTKIVAPVKKFFSGIGTSIKNTSTSAQTSIKSLLQTKIVAPLKKFFKSIGDKISSATSSVKTSISNFITKYLVSPISLLFKNIKTRLSAANKRFRESEIGKALAELGDAIKYRLGVIKDSIVAKLRAIGNSINAMFRRIYDPIAKMGSAFKSKLITLKDAIAARLGALKNALNTRLRQLSDSIKTVFRNIYDSITKITKRVYDPIKNVIVSTAGKIKQIYLDLHKEFVDMLTALRRRITSSGISLKAKVSSFITSIGTLLNNMKTAFLKSKVHAYLIAAKNAIIGMLDTVKKTFSREAIRAKLQAMRTAITTFFTAIADWFKKTTMYVQLQKLRAAIVSMILTISNWFKKQSLTAVLAKLNEAIVALILKLAAAIRGTNIPSAPAAPTLPTGAPIPTSSPIPAPNVGGDVGKTLTEVGGGTAAAEAAKQVARKGFMDTVRGLFSGAKTWISNAAHGVWNTIVAIFTAVKTALLTPLAGTIGMGLALLGELALLTIGSKETPVGKSVSEMTPKEYASLSVEGKKKLENQEKLTVQTRATAQKVEALQAILDDASVAKIVKAIKESPVTFNPDIKLNLDGKPIWNAVFKEENRVAKTKGFFNTVK